MKTAGVLLLLLGAGFAGLAEAYRLRRRARELWELERGMELLRCHLERFCLSTPELARALSRSAPGAASALFGRFERELAMPDERDTAARWETAIAPLHEPERDVLAAFGAVLGRFGAQEQTAAALRTREQLSRLTEAAQTRAERSGKLCVALGFSAGAMLSLVFL